jgi:hypothetical protein
MDGIVGLTPSCMRANCSFIEGLRDQNLIDNWSFKATADDTGVFTTLEFGAPLSNKGSWSDYLDRLADTREDSYDLWASSVDNVTFDNQTSFSMIQNNNSLLSF